jgi:hypothetical protein
MGCCKSKKDNTPDDPPLPDPVPPNIIGYYSWSYGGGSLGQTEANIGIFFSGFVSVASALAEYAATPGPTLVHTGREGPWMTIGGGNDNGIFDVANITDI